MAFVGLEVCERIASVLVWDRRSLDANGEGALKSSSRTSFPILNGWSFPRRVICRNRRVVAKTRRAENIARCCVSAKF